MILNIFYRIFKHVFLKSYEIVALAKFNFKSFINIKHYTLNRLQFFPTTNDSPRPLQNYYAKKVQNDNIDW